MEDYNCLLLEESRIEFRGEMRELRQYTKSQFGDINSQFDGITGKLDAIIELLPNWLRSNGIVTSKAVDDLLEVNQSFESDLNSENVSVTKQSWIDSEAHRAKNDGSICEEISEQKEAADVVFQVFDEMTESIQAALLEEQMHTTMAHMHTKLDVLLDGTVGDVQPIGVQNVTGPYAYHILDEMTPMSRAEGKDDQLIDPYIGGIDFKNITLFDPGGDRKYAMSSSRRVFPALFDKARGSSDNGLEGVDWGIFCMEGDAYKVFDEMPKPDLTEAAEYTSLKAGVWLVDEFERIYPSKDGMVIVSYHVFDEVSKPLPMKIYHLSAGLNHFKEMPNQIIDQGGSSLHYVGYATQHSLDQSKVKHDYESDTISSDLHECELWGVSLQWLTMRRQTSDHHLFHAMPELIVAGHTEGNGGLKSCEYLVVCYPNDLLYEVDVPEVFIFTIDPGTITTLRSVGLTWVKNESHRSINPWVVRGSSWSEHSAIEFSGKQRSQSMMQQSGSQQSYFMGCSKIGCNFFDETSKPFSVDLQENVYGGAMRRNKYELLILARTIAYNIDEFVSIKLMINEIAGLSNHNIRFVMLVSLGYYISVLFLDGVLWVLMIDFPSMSKLEFNPQVYDLGTVADLVGILAHSVMSHPFDHGYVIGLRSCIGVCVCIADWGVTKACKPQMQALIQHLQWVEEAFYKDDVGLPSANKFLLEMLINGTKIVGMATGHTKLHGHKPVVFAGAFVLNNFVWDPGQDVISFYIIEGNDVFKRKGIGIQLACALKQVDVKLNGTSTYYSAHTGFLACSLVDKLQLGEHFLHKNELLWRYVSLIDCFQWPSVAPLIQPFICPSSEHIESSRRLGELMLLTICDVLHYDVLDALLPRKLKTVENAFGGYPNAKQRCVFVQTDHIIVEDWHYAEFMVTFRIVRLDCEDIIDSRRLKRFDADSELHVAVQNLINKDIKPSPHCGLAFSTLGLEHYIWDPGSSAALMGGYRVDSSYNVIHYLRNGRDLYGFRMCCKAESLVTIGRSNSPIYSQWLDIHEKYNIWAYGDGFYVPKWSLQHFIVKHCCLDCNSKENTIYSLWDSFGIVNSFVVSHSLEATEDGLATNYGCDDQTNIHSQLVAKVKILFLVSHFTTLRTRRFLRGRICHDPRFKSDKYELLAVSDVICDVIALIISYFIS